MSINVKVYNKIGYEDVRPGMVLRIVTEGPGIKSDVEGKVKHVWGWSFGSHIRFNSEPPRAYFWGSPNTPHIIAYPEYLKDTTVELYEVIDALPDEPTGVGSVVRVVNLAHPDQTREAVKMGREFSWVWSDNAFITTWDSITSHVLSLNYDCIEVLSEGVEL